MTNFEKILSVLCLVALAGIAVAATGCAVDGTVEGKADGKAEVLNPFGSDSKPSK